MAIAVDATSSGSNFYTSTSNLSFAHTVGSGCSILLVGLSVNSNVTPNPVVTYNGSGLTKLTGELGNSFGEASIFYMFNPPAGSANIVVSISTDAFGGDRVASGLSLSGTGTTLGTAFGTPVKASTTSTTGSSSLSITTTVTGSLLFESCNAYFSGRTATASAGQTAIQNSNQGAIAYRANTTPQTFSNESFSFSSTGSPWSEVAVEVLPAASANKGGFFTIM